jgi:hypothetical protein
MPNFTLSTLLCHSHYQRSVPRAVLLALVSRGPRDCGRLGNMAIGTSVLAELNWIKERIGLAIPNQAEGNGSRYRADDSNNLLSPSKQGDGQRVKGSSQALNSVSNLCCYLILRLLGTKFWNLSNLTK